MLLQTSLYKHSSIKLIGILLICLISKPTFADYQTLERVVAIAEDSVVLESELQNKINAIKTEIQKSGREMPPHEVLQEQVLEKIIIEKIQLQIAEKAGIRVSDSTLSDTMKKIASQNGKNLNEFKGMIETEGLVYKDIRDQIRNDLIMSRLRQKMVINRINITDQDVINYLNSSEGIEKLSPAFHLSHILIPNNQEDKLNELLKKIENGSDFTSESQKYGKVSDLGWRKIDQLPTILVEPAQKLDIGEVSQAIKSESGFHLIKLLDKEGGDHKIVSQTRVRHILIKPNEIRSKNEAKHMINDIRQQIINGKKFAEMARTYSEDPVSANDGGNLGWSAAGDFVPQFESMMSASKIGEVSPPFYTDFGWHILEVMERREENIGKEYQLNQARSILQQKQFEDEIQLWIREIRQEAFVDIKDEFKTQAQREKDLSTNNDKNNTDGDLGKSSSNNPKL
jgi:peptidyl-prolyl cis-trans isomerase SurA